MPEPSDFCGMELGDGRYTVRAKLGEGSMGVVYLASDHRLETDVVIKVPTSAALNDPEFAERFQRETRSLVKLKHPHIVTIHDVGVWDGIPFVVMQYLSGGNLRDRLNDEHGRAKPQPAPQLLDWVPSIAKALDFIHKQGFLHRDVKPANILFDDAGNAFLSDFGLAKAVDSASNVSRDASLTAAGFLVGTPNYVAPELVMGHEHDGRVDQYSLAMTAYEAVAGCVPVEGPTASATMVNQTALKIPAVSHYVAGFPVTLSEVLLRGLSKQQKKRYASCEEFAVAISSALHQCLAAGPLPARTPTTKTSHLADSQSSPARATTPSNGSGAAGLVVRKLPCPRCRKVLPLKPQFAGKKARCGTCLHLLLIGEKLSTLKVIGGPPVPVSAEEPLAEAPVTNRARKSGRETTRNESQQTSRTRLSADAEIETLLGEDVFGWKLSPKVMVGLALGTIVAFMLAIGMVIWVQQQTELERQSRELKAKNSRDVESPRGGAAASRE